MIGQLNNFVPFAGDTHELQNGRSEMATWFKGVAGKVNPRSLNATAQGFYIIAADGQGFGFSNHRGVDRMLSFMKTGLSAYRDHPALQQAPNLLTRRERKPPAGTLVLRVYSRISPVPAGSHAANGNIHRDHLWILPDEMEALRSGKHLPSFLNRLARFTFVDAVRGEPNFWKTSEISSATIRHDAGNEFTGSFSMQTTDGRRGIHVNVSGRVGKSTNESSDLLIYAEGQAWGAGTYTPNPPTGKFGIKFAIVVPGKNSITVPPQGSLNDQEYLRP